MGRKIPGKKHRGVKDPLKQQAERLLRLKSKINAPPADPDDQPIPKSLTRLFASTERRGRLHGGCAVGAGDSAVAGGAVRALVRSAGEDARAFSRRISAAARLLIHPPTTYPVEDEEENAKEARMAQIRERRRRRRAHRPPPAPGDAPADALTAAPSRERAPRPELVYERVPFGEVARGPPSLRRARRTPLVHSLLLARSPPAPPAPHSPLAQSDLEAERRERARVAAVAAYRALKLSRKRAPRR